MCFWFGVCAPWGESLQNVLFPRAPGPAPMVLWGHGVAKGQGLSHCEHFGVCIF